MLLSFSGIPASICASRWVSWSTVWADICPLKIRSNATIASSGVVPVPTKAWSILFALPTIAAQPPFCKRKSVGLRRKCGVLISSVAAVCARRSCRLCRWRDRTPWLIASWLVWSQRHLSATISSSREQTLLKVTSAAMRAPPSTALVESPPKSLGAPARTL